MKKCFVIQPFDGGERYDKRYRDILRPAIEKAGLQAYRVDEDPSASVLVEEIERQINDSAVCLAEITTNNPNVWFELGYAIAMRKVVVMVCSDEREHFPFDVQHRSIVRYSTDSTSDFVEAQSRVTAQLKAKISKHAHMKHIPGLTSISRVEGLEQYEIAGLVTVAEEIDSEIGIFQFYEDMERAGFTRLAASLAHKTLCDRSMLERYDGENYNAEPFTGLRVTAKGIAWLLANQDQLTLKDDSAVGGKPLGLLGPEDDLPF